MDNFLVFWGLLLFIGLLFLFGFPYIIYLIFKAFGKSTQGKVLAFTILIGFSFCIIYVIYEDHFFFKSAARKELKELNLVLLDDFEIIKNESGGFSDYYHVFELKISYNDAKRLTGNKDTKLVVAHKNLEHGLKEVTIDIQNGILSFEHVIY